MVIECGERGTREGVWLGMTTYLVIPKVPKMKKLNLQTGPDEVASNELLHLIYTYSPLKRALCLIQL